MRARDGQNRVSNLGRLERFYREVGSESFAVRCCRGNGDLRVHGLGEHRYHVVACYVGRTRAAVGEASRGFQRITIRIPDRTKLQGELYRSGDSGDLCVSLAHPTGHRSGQRNCDRDHDGREGRDLSRVRIDAGRVRGILTGRVSAGRYRLLYRRRRQHAVIPVQCLYADPLLQQGHVPCCRPGPRNRAKDLVRSRRYGETAARGRKCLRVHHVLAFLDQRREFFRIPQPAAFDQGQRFWRSRRGAVVQQSADGAPHCATRGMAGHQGIRL